jgi:catechol 2,3-dioxygenase-like lactoylglutathione lyase family enzyme
MRLLLPVAVLISVLPVAAQLPPPNEKGLAMGHVHLNVTDVDAQKKFWMEQFEAQPLKKDALAGVKVGGMLILFTKKTPDRPSEGDVMDHFGFKVKNTEDVLNRAKAAGFETRPIFKGTEGFRNAYVIGPDKIKIELQEDVNMTGPPVVNHLHFVLTDPLPLRTWYVEKMGFDPTTRGAYQTANVPNINLTFQPTKVQPAQGSKGSTLDHIGFEVKDLEAYCKKLEAAGIKFDVPYRKVPNLGVALAFLTDPQGVSIELTEGLYAY